MSKDVQEEAHASVLILHYGNQLSINYKCSQRLSEVSQQPDGPVGLPDTNSSLGRQKC